MDSVPAQGQHSLRRHREEHQLESLTDTLMERVEKLVRPGKPPIEWGSPHLSTTPTSIAIEELALRTEALASALREIALEVQKLSNQG